MVKEYRMSKAVPGKKQVAISLRDRKLVTTINAGLDQ